MGCPLLLQNKHAGGGCGRHLQSNFGGRKQKGLEKTHYNAAEKNMIAAS